MNSIILTGRLVQKPELKYTTSGRAMCPFAIACNDMENKVDFFECIAWGKQAENLCNFQEKGNMIGVNGRLTTNTYENKEGQKIKKYVVSANTIEFLTTKPKETVSSDNTNNVNPFETFGKEIDINDNFLD